MSEAIYSKFVRQGRDTLEFILFGQEPLGEKVSQTFSFINSSLNEVGIELRFSYNPILRLGYNCPHGLVWSDFQNEMRIPGKPGLCRNGSDIVWEVPAEMGIHHFAEAVEKSGAAEYIAYHELGEFLSQYPLLMTVFSYGQHLNTSPNQHLNISPENHGAPSDTLFFNMSKSMSSDIFGDLLASSLSPLTPTEQIQLIDGLIDGKKLKEILKGRSFTKREMEFAKFQKLIFEVYQDKCELGYAYGQDFFDAQFTPILACQREFNEDKSKRKYLQLLLYDAYTGSLKEPLINLLSQGSDGPLNCSFNLVDILKKHINSLRNNPGS